MLLAIIIALLSFSACGGSGSTTTPPSVTYTIGGTVSSLSGTGLVLQDNGGDSLSIGADGPFTFATHVLSGSTYKVTVLTQPSSPAQTCTVTNGTGTAGANVSSVQVACGAPTYTIGGRVSNFTGGAGLVLQDNGGDNLPIGANGGFTFTTAVASGGTYNVTVLTQPSGPPQTCAVTNGTGTASANVTTVQILCTSLYTVGGAVSGLSGIGLVLQDNGGNNLPVSANGAFTFTTTIPATGTYNVTVLTQPSSPAQICVIANGSGAPTENVTNIQASCTTGVVNEWTWIGGSDILSQTGTYGTEGTAAPGNVPGSRQNPASWSDASGNFWLFGGNGFGAAGATGYFNDLWKYGASEWTWVNGSSLTNQTGSYGSEGVAAPGNVPGARWGVVSSVDTAGNFWIFGGKGYDSAGLFAYLNDLWQYSAGTGEWIWRSGSNFVDQVGNYGIEGSPAPGNVPGAREAAVSWTDTAGNFWLFGGSGYDSSGSFGYLNDLWEYSAGEWTWISGSNVFDQLGIYGTQGTASPSNVPGGRINAMGWVDKSGNFWLFGGFGFGTNSGGGSLNDLWKYSAGEWTWMGGSTTADQFATYGTLGTGSPGNTPGARIGSATWIDASGNFWLFGGQGYGSYEPSGAGQLNDLWKYSAGEWTWMGGSTVTNLPGTYGTQGTSAPANIPGSRSFTATWIDASGNFWLFGGYGDDSAGTEGDLNDLWKYQLLN